LARQRRRRQGGAALLLVIWVVALLSLLAATALQITTTTAHIAEAGLVRSRLQAASEGAVNLALLEIVDPDSNSPWPVDGTSRTLEIGGQQVTVSIRDEAGKVDVNQAPDELLKAVLVSSGATTDDARKWVDSLDGRRAKSANRDLPSMPTEPDSRLIRTVDAVAGIARIPSTTFRCIRPALTVYTGLRGVDRRYASEAVRRALARSLDDAAYSAPDNAVSGIVGSESFAGRVFAIEATANFEEAKFSRRLVLRITGDPDRPFLVAWWGEDFGENAVEAC